MEKTNPAAAGASVGHDDHQDLLDDLMAQVAPCFARRETRLTCKDMVHGLLSELEDRNCWTLAEAAGHACPYRMQHLLSRARCDEQRMPTPPRAGPSAVFPRARTERTRY